MSDAPHPYIVKFTHDTDLPKIDHSKEDPGPDDGKPKRAGYTSVLVKPRLSIVWGKGPKGADGRVPIYASAVYVTFRLTDYLIAITSDFTAGYCAYRVTRRHEIDAHIKDPIRIFHSYRKRMVARLSLIRIPTEKKPQRVHPDDVENKEKVWEDRIIAMMGRTRRDLKDHLKRARDRHDSPENYRLVYRQCSDKEWATGK